MSEIDIRVEDGVGRITLNRPKALNALSYAMVLAIDAALAEWVRDDGVRSVLVDGAGERGLCAGGDIRAIYDVLLRGDYSLAETFFRAEYVMNARIAAFPKPYVALMDGITMGGGIGVSAHGRLRIVTERSRLAMPETGIGFVPDVGGTYLLAAAPDEFGTHAALTSMQMGAADAILCGLADICLPSSALPDFIAAAKRADTLQDLRDKASHLAVAPTPGVLAESAGWISRCYAGDDAESIVRALADAPEDAAREAAKTIMGKSPTSVKITLRALREARGASLGACLEREFRLAMACMHRPDFREGVRAAVVDKDRNPRWSPARLEDVSDAEIDAMFAPSQHGSLGLAT
jgi:enoyl-CoA hydratase